MRRGPRALAHRHAATGFAVPRTALGRTPSGRRPAPAGYARRHRCQLSPALPWAPRCPAPAHLPACRSIPAATARTPRPDREHERGHVCTGSAPHQIPYAEEGVFRSHEDAGRLRQCARNRPDLNRTPPGRTGRARSHRDRPAPLPGPAGVRVRGLRPRWRTPRRCPAADPSAGAWRAARCQAAPGRTGRAQTGDGRAGGARRRLTSRDSRPWTGCGRCSWRSSPAGCAQESPGITARRGTGTGAPPTRRTRSGALLETAAKGGRSHEPRPTGAGGVAGAGRDDRGAAGRGRLRMTPRHLTRARAPLPRRPDIRSGTSAQPAPDGEVLAPAGGLGHLFRPRSRIPAPRKRQRFVKLCTLERTRSGRHHRPRLTVVARWRHVLGCRVERTTTPRSGGDTRSPGGRFVPARPPTQPSGKT